MRFILFITFLCLSLIAHAGISESALERLKILEAKVAEIEATPEDKRGENSDNMLKVLQKKIATIRAENKLDEVVDPNREDGVLHQFVMKFALNIVFKHDKGPLRERLRRAVAYSYRISNTMDVYDFLDFRVRFDRLYNLERFPPFRRTNFNDQEEIRFAMQGARHMSNEQVDEFIAMKRARWEQLKNPNWSREVSFIEAEIRRFVFDHKSCASELEIDEVLNP